MPSPFYTNRDMLKAALSLPATSTAEHVELDAVLEGVSREIDRHISAQFYPSSGTRYITPRRCDLLELDYPLLAVDSITLDTDGDASYESTLDATSYYTLPDNATANSPRQPFWALELRARSNATSVFPVGVRRGVKVTGTWGWYDERTETTAKPTTGISAAATVWDMAGASNLHPGQTVRVDSEQVFVVSNALSGSATAATSGQITVQRAQNGTTGATHSSLSTMSVYTYPIVERAALYQAQLDYRVQDAPLGGVAGDLSGTQIRAPGGLHPFTRRLLDENFRTPVVG